MNPYGATIMDMYGEPLPRYALLYLYVIALPVFPAFHVQAGIGTNVASSKTPSLSPPLILARDNG